MLRIAPNTKILPVLIGLPYPKGYEDIATTYYKMKPEDFLNLSKEPEKLKRFKEFAKVRTEIILKNTANAIFDEVIAVGGVNEHNEWWYEEKELKDVEHH